MDRNKLKQFWLSIPTSEEVTKTIIVEINKNPYWPGYGTIEIINDGPDGFSTFKTHQKDPLQYLFNCKEYKTKEYKLIIK